MIISHKWIRRTIYGEESCSWIMRSVDKLFCQYSKNKEVARMRYDGLGFQTYKVSDTYYNCFMFCFEL